MRLVCNADSEDIVTEISFSKIPTVTCLIRRDCVHINCLQEIRIMPYGTESGLSSLILPEPSCHALDIFFVHGLNGHRCASWTNRASELWPLWLREDLVGARAWTYGYDASIIIASRDDIKLYLIRFLENLVEKGVGRSVCICRLYIILMHPVIIETVVQARSRRIHSPNYIYCI